MKRLAAVAAVLALVLFVSLLAPITAQAPVPEYITVITAKAHPGRYADFEDYIKKLNAAAAKIGNKTRVDAYQFVQGASIYQYDFVTAVPTLALLDTEPGTQALLIKAYGEAEARKVLVAGRAAIQEAVSQVMRVRPELSSKAADATGSPYFQLVRVEIDPAMTTQYEDYLAKIKVARDKDSRSTMLVRFTPLFGQAFVYFTALPFTTFAERGKWLTPAQYLTNEFGESTARSLIDTQQRAVKRQDVWVVAWRRDLSRIPAAGTD